MLGPLCSDKPSQPTAWRNPRWLSRLLLSSASCLIFSLQLSACGPKTPIKLGFIGGLSGKFADLGSATRNGALLAVELANAAGGVDDRKILLIEKDDQQNPQQALLAMQELSQQAVVAVVGPATSSIAVAVAPVANAKQLLMVSSTGTTNKLSGKDDYFFRVIGDAAFYGRAAANFHYSKAGIRRVAVIIDMANADYTESWSLPYIEEFSRLGGQLTLLERFTSTGQPDHIAIAKSVLASRPDMVLTVTSSVDSALIAQRVKALSPHMQMACSAWASTERLIELGGAATEGMYFEQYFDRFDSRPKFQEFVRAYRARFRADPGYAGLLGYDAANLVITGLRKNQDATQLKKTLLEIAKFEGAQDLVALDAYGDVSRKVYFGVVKSGKFAKPE
jgi:branched-chain amino acid transport system substrate-binding protein